MLFRAIAAGIGALVAAVIYVPSLFAPSPATLLQREAHATVMVLHAGEHHGGSGVLVGPRLVLTAEHVTHDVKGLEIDTFDGKKISGSTVWTSPALDLALVQLSDDAGEPTAKLACRAPQVDEPITVVGHPYLEAHWFVSHGTISGLKPMKSDDAPIVTADVTVAPGNSGGPAFDAAGDVLGITDIAIEAMSILSPPVPSGVAGFVPVSALCGSIPHV